MRFQHFTYLNVTKKELGRIFSTDQTISKHWELKMDDPECEASRKVELIFEEVRLKEFSTLPSRKHCKFFFDLNLKPLMYAASMSFIYEQYHLVEVEILDGESNFVRVNKSLLTCRIKSNGKLMADDEEIVEDARNYWRGVKHPHLDEEVLFIGRFRYTQILRKAAEQFIPALIRID